jgi:DNA-binding transcriptional MerR regulator
MEEKWSIHEVSNFSRLTSRTLRYFEEIGLLTPVARDRSGVRMYSKENLTTLQRIMLLREQKIALKEIKEILNGNLDDLLALQRHKQFIEDEIAALYKIKESVSYTILHIEKEREMDASKMFDGFDPTKYQAEVQERWSDTKEYKESKVRTRRYTTADFQAAKNESELAVLMFISAMDAGLPPMSPQARKAAEAHRQAITNWYYDCSYEVQLELAKMYLADPRFAENYESRRIGLTQYVHDAIEVNAED